MIASQTKFNLVRLEEIADIAIGKTPPRKDPKNFGQGTTWVSISDLDGSKVVSDTKEELTELGIKKSGIKIVPKGTLLFSFKLSIGKVAFAGKDLYTNEAIAALKWKKSVSIHPDYMYYVMKEFDFTETVDKAAKGLTLNKAKLKELQIPLPPLPEQQRIAAMLDAADAYRQKTKALIAKYDELAQSIFLDMFGDPVKNEKGWEKIAFGEFITVLTDYHSNGSYESLRDIVTLKSEPDYALMVRTTDLENDNFEEGVNYIDEKAYNHLDKSKVFGGEIIINKIGSAGKVYRMPHLNRPVSLGMNAFLLRFNELINDVFLYFQLVSSHGEREIQKRVKGAVTKTIRKDALREVPLISPPLALQNQFAERIEALEAQKAQAQQSLEKAEELFGSLLQECFGKKE